MVKRVCIRSSVNIDEFFEVEHIVLSGETMASSSYSRRPGGKGANCAAAVAKASARPDAVDFCGTISAEDTWLGDTLASYGVGVTEKTLHRSEQLPTGRAIIQLSKSTADNSIILVPGCNYADYPLPSAVAADYSHLLVQNEIPLSQTCQALQAARAAGIVTIFNPSPIPAGADIEKTVPWNVVDWLVLNHDEADTLARAFGRSEGSDALEKLSYALPRATGIVMTKGSQGVEALLAQESGDFVRLAAPCGRPVAKIVDTTGAGDTFTGYLASMLMQLGANLPTSKDMEGILSIASEAATACCEKNGAMEAIPTIDEVRARFVAQGLSFPAMLYS